MQELNVPCIFIYILFLSTHFFPLPEYLFFISNKYLPKIITTLIMLVDLKLDEITTKKLKFLLILDSVHIINFFLLCARLRCEWKKKWYKKYYFWQIKSPYKVEEGSTLFLFCIDTMLSFPKDDKQTLLTHAHFKYISDFCVTF